MPRGFQRGNKHGRMKPLDLKSKDPLKELAESYLAKMFSHKLEPGEQGTAAAVIEKRIRALGG